MRSVRFHVVCFLATIAAAVLLAPAAHAVGRTPGKFAVSSTGAATYTIPIWAPPGPQGMQPNIALAYSSQSGNGYVGVGWSISGLSSIYRCPQTYAQDVSPGPVALATSDALCMDGNRLRLVSGTYGEAGSTYQTEIANFINVTAYGTAGNGPAYFIAQDRNGRSYQYGNGGGSQVLANGGSTAVSWQLNEVSDPASNTMTISYIAELGTAVPSKISWTPSVHGGTSYEYTMVFAYGTNAAPPQGYIGGTSFKNPNLLSSITINYAGTAVKNYALSYVVSETSGQEDLTQVLECAGSGVTNCLSPTTISYQDESGTAGVATSATTAIPAVSSVELYVNYDFDGNGYRDLVYCSGGSPNTVFVAFGSASGYGAPVNTGIACGALYGDLQATGTDGILANNGGTWYYYTWNGSSFQSVSTGLAYDSTAVQYVLADVNGDGLPDLVSAYLTTTTTGGITAIQFSVYTRINSTEAGSAPSFSSTTTLAYQAGGRNSFGAQLQAVSQYGPVRGFDFNGDGRQDLSLQTFSTPAQVSLVTTYELISTGQTFTGTQISQQALGTYVPVTFLNFNSDACTDYLTGDVIYVSGCNGSVAGEVSLGSANVLGAMDWNGDGLDDILVQNGSTIGVYLSTGVGLSSLNTTSIPYSSVNQYLSFDANGDGLDDLGVSGNSTATEPIPVSYYLHNDAGQPPDLLSNVTDGYGNSASPTYVPMDQGPGSNYFLWNDAVYPYKNYMGPLYIVNQTTFSDPSSASGATYQQVNYYAGAWTNLQGRGFTGFGNVQTYDSRNGLWHTVGYDRAFPYIGMLNADLATQNNSPSTYLWYVSDTLSATTLSSTANQERYFPYASNVTRQAFELGTGQTRLVKTTSTNYTYDSYGNATTIAKTITDNDTGSPYYTDTWLTTVTNTPDVNTSSWCLSLLTQSQVTDTSSVGSAVTLTKQFTPDTTNCRYNQVLTQPNTSYAVSEAFTYDSFGNVSTDVVTGTGMTARTASANWGTTGQIPMSVTDASGATTQFNYNFSFGVPSSTTDPNGVTTSWSYDAFGRKTQEIRPDNTSTSWTYNPCSGCDPKPRMTITQTQLDTGGNAIRSTAIYTDMLDRVIYQTGTEISGATVWSTVRYFDSLGRVVSSSMPYAISGSSPGATTYSYDILNRITGATRPVSATNSTNQSTGYTYEGRTTIVTDALSNATTIVTDVNGWLRQTRDPYGYTVTTVYDAAGSRVGVTDSAGNTLWSGTYAYGVSPFLLTATDMDLGAWSYTVDALGERTGWTDAKGQSFHETFDALSRPLTRTEPDQFTQWSWGASAASYNIGKLQSVCMGPAPASGSAGACTSSYYAESETYDSVGRPSQRAITIPSTGTFTYTWAYNATTGFLNTLTYPISTSGYALQLQYAYQNGFPLSVTDVSDSPNVTVWQANATNAAGQLTQETLGNGIVTNRAFDAVTGWLSSIQSGVSGGTGVQNQSFLYDFVGDVTQRQDNNLGLTENVYYDNDYRLTSTKLGGTQNLAISYDVTGNITSRSDIASGASWTYDPVRKHAVTQAGSSAYGYSYDGNGNAITRQGSSILWSSYNYPTSISAGSGSSAETVALSYGPDRQRWQQSYAGNGITETTNYVGRALEIVSSAGVTDYRHYIYAGGQAVAVYSRKSTGTNTFSYLLSDHQGSVASITNSSGGSVVNESFTPDGSRRNPTTWSGTDSTTDLTTSAGITREGYTFQTQLGLWMGLNHMNGRVQDAITGRFLSADPHVPDPTNTQSYNRYSYVGNNPLSYTDPTGFTRVKNICTPTCPAEIWGGGSSPDAWGDASWDSSLDTPEDQENAADAWLAANLSNANPGITTSSSSGGGGASQDQDAPASATPPPADQPQGNQLTPPGVSPDGGTVTVCGDCIDGTGTSLPNPAFFSNGSSTFFAPAGTHFQALWQAGRNFALNGGKLGQVGQFVGTSGMFNFQQISAAQGLEYGFYQEAANFGVGVFMDGFYDGSFLGYALMTGSGQVYGALHASNWSPGQMLQWQQLWTAGWNAAQSGNFPVQLGTPWQMPFVSSFPIPSVTLH